MRYGSVCSGIEAATQAWHPLGWQPSFLSEIDDFPRAVLRHHYPDVPLHGDFTTIRQGEYEPIDILVGGTPCQSFSIAGLRGGLGDDRGNLALEYLRLADRLRPRWLVWENVPGVLSSGGGRDFGAIVGGMVELGYGAAWRVLDAQYVRTLPFPWAVPQRRRRVFLVGHLGDWRRAAAILVDRESLSGHPPPRREAGKNVAPTISARPTGGGGLGTDFDLDGGLVTSHEVSQPLLAKGNASHRADAESYVAVANSGNVGYCLAACGQQSLDAETEKLIAFNARQDPDAWEGRSGPIDTDGGTQAIAFSSKDYGADASEECAPTLRAMGHAESHPNAGGQVAVAFDMRGRDGGAMPEGPHDTANIRAASGGSSRSYVALAQNSRDEVRLVGGDGSIAGALAAEAGMKQQTYVANNWSVRRLTPVEAERLQGFPDGYTDIPWRGKPHSPDGRRYKALGNSMAVNVMRWIGDRIALVDALEVEQ